MMGSINITGTNKDIKEPNKYINWMISLLLLYDMQVVQLYIKVLIKSPFI